jgi:hypothetical protein
MSRSRKDFPDWETLYKSQRGETMLWYNQNFDSDLEKELDERKPINNNNDSKKFLDLGTGKMMVFLENDMMYVLP